MAPARADTVASRWVRTPMAAALLLVIASLFAVATGQAGCPTQTKVRRSLCYGGLRASPRSSRSQPGWCLVILGAQPFLHTRDTRSRRSSSRPCWACTISPSRTRYCPISSLFSRCVTAHLSHRCANEQRATSLRSGRARSKQPTGHRLQSSHGECRNLRRRAPPVPR